ncbi:hypothetical protein C6P46_000428 [Rhodotorula mucilaginosa]|uniref:HECT-type E3 ubiquitin transferase n=1 Tax=Rhodotorula mucilaginosa TaxID=5537 RepID=A0A9P7B384_RHOMI|nr:hypothetical protein C6P46_000428 [Rhodotorula mucilaginosa]
MFNTFDYINPSIHAAARRYSVGVCGAGVAKTTRRTSQERIAGVLLKVVRISIFALSVAAQTPPASPGAPRGTCLTRARFYAARAGSGVKAATPQASATSSPHQRSRYRRVIKPLFLGPLAHSAPFQSSLPLPDRSQQAQALPHTRSRPSQLLSPDEEQIKTIYSALTISDLWKRLGDALGGIEAKPDLLYLSTVLLPLIESLLVVNKFTDASSTEFIDFTPAHSKILNTMVRNNPLLMSGSFAVLVRNSSMLNFENKRSFFFSVSCTAQPHYPTINLNVRRARVFEDLYHVFLRETGDEIKYGKLNGKFYDEQGVDAGGVTREWFGVLARQMFNPGYALCQPQAADPLTYQPNKASALVWILDNYTDCIINLTFSVEGDEFGVTDVVDLIPNGRNGPVTNKTRHDYVHRIAVERLSFGIRV